MTTNIGKPVLDGEVVKRPMQFFWLVDCSGSMEGSKMSTLNSALPEAVATVQKALESHPEVQVMMRVIKFSDNAQWHIGPQSVPIENFIWSGLEVGGITATAKAINMLSEELDMEKMGRRAYPPVCILLSDGYCTDTTEEYDAAIANLEKLPWAKKAVRLVIAVGNESEYDEAALLKFTNHKEVGVIKAHTPEELVVYIKWASTTASLSASVPQSGSKKAGDDPIDNILPPPPTLPDPDPDSLVF